MGLPYCPRVYYRGCAVLVHHGQRKPYLSPPKTGAHATITGRKT